VIIYTFALTVIAFEPILWITKNDYEHGWTWKSWFQCKYSTLL